MCRATRDRPRNAVRSLPGVVAVGVRVMMCSFVLVVAFVHRFVSRRCGRAVVCGRAIQSAVV